MIRSWCALCALEPLEGRRAHVKLWQHALEQPTIFWPGGSGSASTPTGSAECSPSMVCESAKPLGSTSRTSTTKACSRWCASPARAGEPAPRSWPGPPKPRWRPASASGAPALVRQPVRFGWTGAPPSTSWTAPPDRLHGRHPRVKPHVLRRSWTTLAIDAGVPQDQIQHDGGWVDARMVAYYTRDRLDQALRAATHSVAAYVLSAG